MTDNHDAGIHQDDDFLDDAEGAHNTMSINSYYRYGIAAAIHSQYHAKKTLSVVVLSNKTLAAVCQQPKLCTYTRYPCTRK
jgi:hypothetical protein